MGGPACGRELAWFESPAGAKGETPWLSYQLVQMWDTKERKNGA